ncbi:hypothetical protein KY285_025781 [Solanum tuberosum]|nr:hypothetical protein KY289_024380 [Solanum tuberosum]KAH0677980.1 hypothetical protein KY285_025781 [Solanum tuberosum]
MSQETVSTEEVRILRQQMAEMYEAWMSGQAPPFSICDYLHTNMSPPIQVSISNPIYPPGFGPYTNTSIVVGTSTVCPLSTFMKSNPFFVPIVLTNSVPKPIMEPKSNSDPPPKVQYDRDYTPEVTFKITDSYPNTHQYSSHVEAEKTVKNEEHEEMARKMKSLEQIREQAARVKPPMKEFEMIDVFLQAQEPDYFHYLLSVVGKTFTEVIKIGEMVENGIKFGKIVSQAALKAITQVIKNGSGNLGGKKMKEDVANVVSDTQKDPHSKGFNPVARCAYHLDSLGHSTEDCRTLKSEVEKMIQEKMIVVQYDNLPNVTLNPLPAPNDVHFIEIMGDDNSLNSKGKIIEISGAFTKANVQRIG